MDALIAQDPACDAVRSQAPSHLLAALDGLPAGIVTMDRSTLIRFASRRLGAILDISPAAARQAILLIELLEASAVLSAQAARQVNEACLAAIAGGTDHRGLVKVDAPDGSRVLSLSVAALPDQTWIACFEEIDGRRAADGGAIESAGRDPLTGLLACAPFRGRVAEALAGTRRVTAASGGGSGAAILLADLHGFKRVNDMLGHQVGSGLLRLAARRLAAQVRQHDAVAHLGAGEFALLVSPAPERAALADLAARLVDLLGRPFLVDGHVLNIDASIGVAVAPQDGPGHEQLMRNAGLALCDAKGVGRSAVRFFASEMNNRACARRSLEIDLRRALALQQFELNYQPQIDLATNGIVGFEALLRWRHPTRGLVSPTEFIPLAEEIGLIVPLGDWVLLEACREAARWPGSVSVAVNTSPNQFEDPSRLIESVERALRLARLPGQRLEIEITESSLLRNETAVLAALRRFREMEVRVAMDDFGTGYSSLGQLQSFPFNRVKIDRSFLRSDGEASSQNAIIRAINALGVSLGMSTIAEGVETDEQLARIRTEGCTSVQGFLFSQPVAADQIDRLLREFPAARHPSA